MAQPVSTPSSSQQITLVPDARETALEMFRDGATHQDVADALGVSRATWLRLRRRDKALKEAVEEARAEGAEILIDMYQRTPYEEPDAARARVKLEALRGTLELRYPERYGKRYHDVTHRTLDMSGALERANRRVLDATRDRSGTYVVPGANGDSQDADSDSQIEDLIA